MEAILVAPCGMNCNTCMRYLRKTHNVPREVGPPCDGCVPRDRGCIHKKGLCKKLARQEIRFCYECSDFPCDRLQTLSDSYRERRGADFIEHLTMIRDQGMEEFLQSEREKYRCHDCGDVVCVHDKKCYGCGTKQAVKK